MDPKTLHSKIIEAIQYAARELFIVIYREHSTIAELQQRRDNIRHLLDQMRDRLLAADFDDDGIRGGVQQAYIDLMKTQEKAAMYEEEIEEEIKTLEASIQTKSAVSIPVLAGAVLQIAKLVISVVWGTLEKCPNGRPVSTQNLKTVIWQGRNQSMHYDEAGKPPLIECFKCLHKDFGERFDLTARPSENLALDVIKVLEWHDYEAFEKDLRSLLM